MKGNALGATIAAGVALAVGIAGCASGGHERKIQKRQIAQRTCGTSGTGGFTQEYRSHALLEGPVSLGALRGVTPTAYAPVEQNGRFGSIESIVVVAAGAQATLTVPASERGTIGLLYDGARFRSDGAYRLSDLDSSVRFLACRDKRFNRGVSQFDGGYVVTRRQCVQLRLSVEGERPRDIRFPAGAACPARTVD
jgi:hypothetical protein